jgi:hypothetical protein
MRQLSRADRAWTVIDTADHKLAGITPRRFVIELGPDDMRAKLGRRWREARSLLMTEKILRFEVIESGPDFDWHQHGLLVALAAYRRYLTSRGGSI